jgi:hypothetical protein
MERAIMIEILEVKILIYLLGLLQIPEKKRTIKNLWRKGFSPCFRRDQDSKFIIPLITSLPEPGVLVVSPPGTSLCQFQSTSL